MPWKCFLNCVRPETEDVRQLDYQHSMLQDVPPQVFAYERTLEELYLDSNRIRDLPRPLFHCHGLRVLSMSDNDVQSLPPAIASLINLQHLDLSRNELCGIPDNIKGCKHLVYVDVSVNQLEKLPEGFTQLLSLEELYLNDTCLDFLPANFGRLTKLRILELRENNLNTLPKSIARLTSLERMDIGQNEFSDLPEVIGRLVNLTELWVDCNRVRSVPKFIGNLKKLMHFDASTNNINWIAPEIGSCTSLTDLTLSCNEIQEIPDTIGNLKQLVTLKLDDNQLTSLPNTIGKLSNLEEFILSQNDFESLPPCIGLLRKLNILNADDNMLEELPPEVGSCTSLTILSVRSNKLQEVPAELGHLPKIRVMNLSDNQLRNLPVSLLNLTFLTALWLSNNQSTPLTTLQQDVDKVTGQTVCINFMLPQSAQELYLAENDMKDDVRRSPRQLEKASSDRPHIHFAADANPEVPGHLVRAPTPYPKELRAMAKHARSYQQQHTRRASRESDGEATLLGEMVSPGPKGVLIKEAKVKKPSTVPLAQPTASMKGKDDEDDVTDQCVDDSINISKQESTDVSADETSPVLASGGGPIIREAKCVRQVTSAAEEREKFFSNKEVSSSSLLGENFSPTEIQRLPTGIQKAVTELPRSSISSEQQQQPPPYHIAAAYSKQAAYFQVRAGSPALKQASPLASSKKQFSSTDKCLSPEQKTHNDSKEPLSSAALPVVQLNSVTTVTEKIHMGDKSDGKKNVEDSSKQTNGIKIVSVLEEEYKTKRTDIGESDKFEHPAESKENDIVDSGNKEFSVNEIETGALVMPNECQNLLTRVTEVPESKSSSEENTHNGVESSHIAEIITTVISTEAVASATTTTPDATTATSVTAAISIPSSNVSQRNSFTIPTTPTLISATIPVIAVNDTRENEKQGAEKYSNNTQTSGLSVESPPDNENNVSPSSKCRIPVRLGEPMNLKKGVLEVDDLLKKPSTFTQDKATAGDSIFAPTPQRPGCNSPTSPKSPTSVSKLGTKIPSLLPSVTHGMGKTNLKPQSENRSASPMPEKVPSPESKYFSLTGDLSQGKSDLSVKSLPSGNWPSISDTDSLSESLYATRIPQPGFYSNSPLSYQSSKRSSLSSQSSGSSRPGSIAPVSNISLDSSLSPQNKEAGYNYLNKTRFPVTDHNLNISSKIPTAASPSPSSSHFSQLSSFSSNLEGGSSQRNLRSILSNEQSPLVSKIPTLTSIPKSPTSSRSGSLPQRQFPISAADGSSNRTNVESPTKQTKTWMFGPHKNATVFPVIIKKNPGLGFSITGGLGSPTPSEKKDGEGIFVTKVHPNGPASSCLQPGDKILEVDGTDFTKVEHDQAVGILKQTGNVVNMMISRQQ